MNRSKFVHLKFFYNFSSLHFSVRHVSIIASSPEKKKRSKISKRSNLRGFDGISDITPFKRLQYLVIVRQSDGS
jgi:hypothetical protein